MQIVMMATGTRGDVQPLVALGKALKTDGQAVRLIAGANFADWITGHGLDVYPTVDIERLMRSEQGNAWIEAPTQRQQLGILKRMTNDLTEEVVQATLAGTAGADLLIGGFLSQSYLLALREKHGLPAVTAALQPFRPTSSGPASLVPILPRQTSPLNRWMGRLADRFSWSVVEHSTNVLRQRLGLAPSSARHNAQAGARIPALYAFSRHVIPPTFDTHSYTTGYWFLDEPYSPPDDLTRFIEAGEPPIYIGFGSMPHVDPARTVALVAEALRRVGRRGLLARGWSQPVSGYDHDSLFLLDSVPHDWLFPKMAALVHHGGAGTTAAGLRAGKPALPVPHLGDQPFWARRLHDLGVSPKPLPHGQLTVDVLTERLRRLLADAAMQRRAADLGERLRAEDGVANAMTWMRSFIHSL